MKAKGIVRDKPTVAMVGEVSTFKKEKKR